MCCGWPDPAHRNGFLLIVDPKLRAVSASTLLVFLLGLNLSGHAQSDPDRPSRERDFDIPQLPLTLALQRFFDQLGEQYGYIPNTPQEEQILVGPLKGRYTPEQALAALLPEGFDFFWVNGRTVSIISPVEKTPPKMPGGSADALVMRAQQSVEAMLVRDSRLWSLEYELPSLVVLGREDIRALGVSTAAELLEYLPQQPFMRSAGTRLAGEQYADLRGLGPDSTLILINGRRVNATAMSFDWNAFDLNIIPLAAIERVEVLLDSMTAAAGADSTGGVINFILKDRYDAPTVEARYGTAAGGAEETRFWVGADHTIGPLHLSGLVDYFAREQLLGSERDLWRDQDYRRFGSADMRSPDSNPGNVTSATLANLPGLGSRFAAVPNHEAGTTLTIADFRATEGSRRLESAFRDRSIFPETDALSFVGSATLALPRRLSAFGELLITDRVLKLREIPVALSSFPVPASNPYNPFGTPVLVNFRLSEFGPRRRETQSQFTRELLGLRHEAIRWTSEFAVLQSDDSARLTIYDELDTASVIAALAQTDPALALNVFDDGPGASPEVLRTLIGAPIVLPQASRETQVSAQTQGQLFELPAGRVSALLGVQYRRSSISVTGRSTGDAARSTSAAFAEFQLPVFDGERTRGPRRDSVFLNLSSRWDLYSDLGATWHSNAAVTWRPTRDLQFRGSYGTSFRAPSLWELYQPRVTVPAVLPDPKRNNEVSSFMVTAGGNPDLENATARSWSLGLLWKQPDIADLQLSGNWWHVEIDRRLTAVTVPVLLGHEDFFSNRVERARPSDSDIAAGIPGRLLTLDFTAANVGALSANGLDLTLAVAIDSAIGRFAPSVSATWMNKFTTVDVPGLDATDRVAVASVFGTIPKWRAVGRIDWMRGAASATAAVRFISRYDDFNVLQIRASDRDIEPHAVMDLQGSIDVGASSPSETFWRDMRVTIGIENVFDSEPQFAEVGGPFGFDVSQGDLRRRFAYLRLTKRF
jgi:iron complex outermembrane recepter protein